MQIVTLTDPTTGAQASVAPELGFNCFSFRAPLGNEWVETLWAHPDFLAGTQRPSGSGIPLLFPFGGRIPGTSFEYEGKTYELEPGDAHGNAIHGFVMQRPWRVVEQSESRVVGEFQASVDEPDLHRRWPADFRIRVVYDVTGGGLFSQINVTNPGDRPLPFGLATHAYFRIPPGGQPSEAEQTIVRVPVRGAWKLAELIPTGEQAEMGELAALPEGIPLAGRAFDNVFTDLTYDHGRAVTSLHNPLRGCTLTQTFDESFRHAVVYTPPHREAICIEPYTALPNPFRLEAAGIPTGLRFLQPSESWNTLIEIRLA